MVKYLLAMSLNTSILGLALDLWKLIKTCYLIPGVKFTGKLKNRKCSIVMAKVQNDSVELYGCNVGVSVELCK